MVGELGRGLNLKAAENVAAGAQCGGFWQGSHTPIMTCLGLFSTLHQCVSLHPEELTRQLHAW